MPVCESVADYIALQDSNQSIGNRLDAGLDAAKDKKDQHQHESQANLNEAKRKCE